MCDNANEPLSYQRSPADGMNTIDQIGENDIDDRDIGKPPLKYN